MDVVVDGPLSFSHQATRGLLWDGLWGRLWLLGSFSKSVRPSLVPTGSLLPQFPEDAHFPPSPHIYFLKSSVMMLPPSLKSSSSFLLVPG